MSSLPEGYEIRELSREEFGPLWREQAEKVFGNASIFNLQEALSENEKSKMAELQKNLSQVFRLNLGLFFKGEFVGWAAGSQETTESFYMRNSAVLPEHRRKGLYTALMNSVLEKVTHAGFQKIYSRHTTTNSAVIIPKLKAGFVITSIEISDIFGALVHLSYFPNPTRLKMMNYRSGEIKPDEEIKRLLKI